MATESIRVKQEMIVMMASLQRDVEYLYWITHCTQGALTTRAIKDVATNLAASLDKSLILIEFGRHFIPDDPIRTKFSERCQKAVRVSMRARLHLNSPNKVPLEYLIEAISDMVEPVDNNSTISR